MVGLGMWFLKRMGCWWGDGVMGDGGMGSGELARTPFIPNSLSPFLPFPLSPCSLFPLPYLNEVAQHLFDFDGV